jgi:hypothetical protein
MVHYLTFAMECASKGGIFMEGAIVGSFGTALNKKVKADANNKLLEEIETVKIRIDTVASHFESEIDPDLVEANIYEMKSLSARYRYLFREARRAGITNNRNHILEHVGRL